ncbi:MAG: hypothetical protein J6Y69_00775 [Treponema sp.]|nr:hypothetical protein [Treponema sp.]
MRKIRIFLTSLLTAGTLAFFCISCQSTEDVGKVKAPEKISTNDDKDTNLKPLLVTELPTIAFSGSAIKYECESLYLNNCTVIEDPAASQKYSIRIENESSTAQIKVRFPAGTYECMISEKAHDNNHASFYVFIDDNPHRMYPSNPPLGTYELTTRSPIYFTIDEPRTILITIRASSSSKKGSTGMYLDYIQFVRRK